MRERWDEGASRRTIIVTAVAAVGSIVFGLRDRIVRWSERARGDDALPHIEAACDPLQDNYEVLAEVGLTSPIELYQLDLQTIDQNIAKAEEALIQADEQSGLPGLNRNVERAITEVEQYLAFQQLLIKAFAIPGSPDGDRLTDAHIGTVLEALEHGSPSDAPDTTPYGADAYADTVTAAAADLTFDALEPHLSHTPEDITAIARAGLESLSQLEALYQKLQAHLFFPELHRTIVDIDQDLSQTPAPGTIADDSKTALEVERSATNHGSLDPLPDEYADYPVGPASEADEITGADVDQSYNQFFDAYQLFETSVEALANDDHARSTAIWTEGLEAMYLAHQETLFS